MHYFILTTLILYLIIYLFFVFIFSRDNFLLLRKNINTDKVFNITFLILLIGLLFARILYVAFHFSKDYFNPLVFFLISYFPGLSVGGGIAASALFIIFYTQRSKLPTLHLLDIFSLSFLGTLPFGIVISLFSAKNLIFSLPLVALNTIIVWVLISLFQKAKLLDGSAAYISMITSAVFIYIVQAFSKIWFSYETLILLGIIGTCGFFIFKQEKLLEKIKKLRGSKFR